MSSSFWFQRCYSQRLDFTLISLTSPNQLCYTSKTPPDLSHHSQTLFHHLPSWTIKSSFQGNQQSPGQAPVCAEISCQGFHPHRALATHHPHPRPPPVTPSEVLHFIAKSSFSPVNLFMPLSDLLHPLTPDFWGTPNLLVLHLIYRATSIETLKNL